MRDDATMTNDTDLELLDRWLNPDRTPADRMGLSGVDGFLTGLVVGPEPITPSEWLPHLWGGAAPDFADTAEAQAVLGAIMRRYNQIGDQLDRDPDGLRSIVRTGADGATVIAGDWAKGFFDAMEVRPGDWRPLSEHERAGAMLDPILLLVAAQIGASLAMRAEEGADACRGAGHDPDQCAGHPRVLARVGRRTPRSRANPEGTKGRPQRSVPLRVRAKAQALLPAKLT